ncbi:MAG: tRNA (guanosine(37)-N1)-methyltransferase TrmD, partial [Bdellovibrionaceae bacterium]|nr:tRNA (guanosine(37)-N1)-methyltransferase TrmD [Pseudobdellovibrionaceae bacterium]
MKFQVLTLFPELIEAGISSGVLSQGLKKSLLSVSCFQLRDVTTDLHRSVDDRPFGGGDGMILMPDILEAAL